MISLLDINVPQKGQTLLSFLKFFSVFLQNESGQNNPYAKEYFGMAYSVLLDRDVAQFVYACIC